MVKAKKFRWVMFLNEQDEQTPVCYLQLGARASNALMRSGIKTIGEVVDQWDTLFKIRSLGAQSEAEVKAAVFAWNMDKIWHREDLLERFAELLNWDQRSEGGQSEDQEI